MARAMNTKMDNDTNKAAENATDDVSSIEAGSVVGDPQYAGEHSSSQQLHRSFTARHVQMIGLAGSIGSGLFIGTGKVCNVHRNVTHQLDVNQSLGSPVRKLPRPLSRMESHLRATMGQYASHG